MGGNGAFWNQYCLIGTITYPVSYQKLLHGSLPRSLRPSQGLSFQAWWGEKDKSAGEGSAREGSWTLSFKPSMWETAGCINLTFVILALKKHIQFTQKRFPNGTFTKLWRKTWGKCFELKHGTDYYSVTPSAKRHSTFTCWLRDPWKQLDPLGTSENKEKTKCND